LAEGGAGPFEISVCDVTRESIPDVSGFSGVIVTGSTSAVYRHEPWMAPLTGFLREAPHAPILCVCFGSQLLAQACGGRVVRNPSGWEIGAVEVALTPQATDDPLFGSTAGRSLMVLQTHEDRIEQLPPGAVPLAGNEAVPIQAFRLGNLVWGVQFHPEIATGALARLISLRARLLEQDAREHGRPVDGCVDRLLATLESPGAGEGRRILDAFARFCLTG
ncbi:MAG TPA: type 1 glutamine amidotransferase, partial [Candidatus Polarisedimenticolia bacterium]|nr:type 1 glutamine amidotransferase [Candidatus Polarisedimenticolia bacterium]